MYKDKMKECILLFKKVASDFKKELNKEKEKGKGKVAKGSFGLTFNKVRDKKDGIKRKALSSRKNKRAIIMHQKYIICKKSLCKNLKTYYYAFPKIALKGGALSART